MRTVISGKIGKPEIREIEINNEKSKVANFTILVYDGSAPIKKREDGSTYKARIPFRCTAWNEHAKEIEQIIADGKNTITAVVEMKHNEYMTKNGYLVNDPKCIIKKIDYNNDLHKQLDSLLMCYEDGKINQIFEKEIQPSFNEDMEYDTGIEASITKEPDISK